MDVDFGAVLDFLAQDPQTYSILLYVEGVRDARSFMSGLRIAAQMKPVVVIKAGRHIEGARAAITHTGAMIGADDVFDAALQRAGVVRAMTIEQLFSAAQLLAKRNRVSGTRLAIVTNGGGLGVMATDRAIDLGVTIATLSEDTVTQLNESLPAQWSHDNPIDLLGDASAERYEAAVNACQGDPNVDGILVMLSPQAMTDTVACAQAVIDARKVNGKLVLACWMGEQQVEAANQLFAQHHLPGFPNPESSVEAFSYLATHYHNQQLLMQVPGPLTTHREPDVDADEKGVMALDARIVVEHSVPSLDRYSHMAIHPYPNHLITLWQLADGTNIRIRPIRPEDASIEKSFVHELSPQSKYFRFMQALNELTQPMLVRFTQLDYNRELALIAALEYSGEETELGVARYVMNPDGESCEFALVVADKWQHKGIGSHLMTSLIEAARQVGIKVMNGEILANNQNMLKLARNLGFCIHTSADDPGIREVSKLL